MIVAARKMLSPAQYTQYRTRIVLASRCLISVVSMIVNFYIKFNEKVLNNNSR